jgi:hypothetical protein
VSDLPAVPLTGDDEQADDGPLEPEADPWPRLCEMLALALAGVLLCLLLGAALLAADAPLGATGAGVAHIGLATRLRYGSEYISTLDGLVAVGAVLFVAFDGIASGERRGASTTLGNVALYAAAVLSLVLAVASAARSVDIVAGNISLIGPTVHGRVPFRIGGALLQFATCLLAIAACWLALRTLGDGDRRELEEAMEGEGEEDETEEEEAEESEWRPS